MIAGGNSTVCFGSSSEPPLGSSSDPPFGSSSGSSLGSSSGFVIPAATPPILSFTVGSNFSIVSSPVSTLNVLKNEPSTPFICSPF